MEISRASELYSCAFALIAWLIFYIMFSKDRSRYRNVPMLGICVFLTIPALCSLTGDTDRALTVSLIIITALLLLVPFMLIANGYLMWRREGHSLANILSLALGLFIGVGEISTLITVFSSSIVYSLSRRSVQLTFIGLLFSVTVIYVSVCVLMFVLYSLFLMLIPRKSDFDYAIIHGAGLIHGDKISKLLSDRIDKAIDIYNSDPSPTIIIPSGGKGGDETISEAEAMAQYLREHGVPDSDIILEDKSTTTLENLENCKAIIESREGRKYTVLVTSNYHVYRALRYCRKIGFDCTGVGSHVAPYYWPSAVIREFIAIHAEKKHLIIFIGGWVLLMGILLIAGI